MTARAKGLELLQRLKEAPSAFLESNNAMELLDEYFDGLSLETLRPFLQDPDLSVRRTAVFLASELGVRARPLIGSLVPLAVDRDAHIRCYALDVLVTCAVGSDASRYLYVALSLEDPVAYIRTNSMSLMSRGSIEQFWGVLHSLIPGNPTHEIHKRRIMLLLEEHLSIEEVGHMISHQEPLFRKYGAIVAWRMRGTFAALAKKVLSSGDSDLRAFWDGVSKE